MVDAALARASTSYSNLMTLVNEAAQRNPSRMMAGREPIAIGRYAPPAPPVAPGVSAPDLTRMLDGQSRWFDSEAQRIRHALAESVGGASQPVALAPAPRTVPLALTLAEVTRGPWLWFRWLLFPPFTMIALAVVGALSTKSALGAAALLASTVGLTWGIGFQRGLQRVALLERGEVPVILQREEKVYRTRNTNIPMFRAHGWDVRLEAYTGRTRGSTFTVQTTRAVIGRVLVDHGPPFDGMLLVDPDSAKGCAHMDFASLPVPDERGQWRAQVPTRVWLGLAGGVVISSALLGLALALVMGFKIVS